MNTSLRPATRRAPMKTRPVTDYPMDEEDEKALAEFTEACRRHDRAAALRAVCKIKLSPPSLLMVKRVSGAEAIRKAGYNTTLADKEFGSDWLDRDDII